MQANKIIVVSFFLMIISSILLGCNGASVKRCPEKVYYGYRIKKDRDSSWVRIYVYSLDTSYVVVKKNTYNIP